MMRHVVCSLQCELFHITLPVPTTLDPNDKDMFQKSKPYFDDAFTAMSVYSIFRRAQPQPGLKMHGKINFTKGKSLKIKMNSDNYYFIK